MSMNLNYPVKMLPQEVKTPLVPDSEMSSIIGSAEYKRKEAPDALAAPDAKKTATSYASKNDKGVLQELDRLESSEGSDMTDGEEVDGPETDEEGDMSDEEVPLQGRHLASPDDEIVHYTTDFGDLQALSDKLARTHGLGSELHRTGLNACAAVQLGLESSLYCCHPDRDFSAMKLRVEIIYRKDGGRVCVGNAACIPKK